MKVKVLKERLDDTLMSGIINIVKDPTIGESKKEQLKGLIFNFLTDDLYWDEADDELEL